MKGRQQRTATKNKQQTAKRRTRTQEQTTNSQTTNTRTVRTPFELELELIQTQMTQKPMLRAEVYARALRASQNRKEDSV